jgi:hypothetical protein
MKYASACIINGGNGHVPSLTVKILKPNLLATTCIWSSLIQRGVSRSPGASHISKREMVIFDVLDHSEGVLET